MMQSFKMGLIALFGAPSSSGSHDLDHTGILVLSITVDHPYILVLSQAGGSPTRFGALFTFGSPANKCVMAHLASLALFLLMARPCFFGTHLLYGSPRLFMVLANDLARPFTMILTSRNWLAPLV